MIIINHDQVIVFALRNINKNVVGIRLGLTFIRWKENIDLFWFTKGPLLPKSHRPKDQPLDKLHPDSPSIDASGRMCALGIFRNRPHKASAV